MRFEPDWLAAQAVQVNSSLGHGVRIPAARSASEILPKSSPNSSSAKLQVFHLKLENAESGLIGRRDSIESSVKSTVLT
jgi:hypothetical protein